MVLGQPPAFPWPGPLPVPLLPLAAPLPPPVAPLPAPLFRMLALLGIINSFAGKTPARHKPTPDARARAHNCLPGYALPTATLYSSVSSTASLTDNTASKTPPRTRVSCTPSRSMVTAQFTCVPSGTSSTEIMIRSELYLLFTNKRQSSTTSSAQVRANSRRFFSSHNIVNVVSSGSWRLYCPGHQRQNGTLALCPP